MARDSVDIATASDRIAAERMIAAVKRKDVEAFATELASFRARAMSVAMLRVESTFGIARVERIQVIEEPVEKDPRQTELFDGE